MFKLTDAGDLEKGGKSLGGFFAKRAEELEKNHSSHMALASHHDAMSKAHTAQGAHHQTLHDAMGNDHEDKAHHATTAAFHKAMAAHEEACSKAHGSMAESAKAEMDTMKALAGDWGGTAVKAAGVTATSDTADVDLSNVGTVDDMLKNTSQALMRQTLASFKEDPVVKEAIRELCLKQIGGILGDKLVPDQVSAVNRGFPGLTAFPRSGAPDPNAAKAPNVPVEFAKLVQIDDDPTLD